MLALKTMRGAGWSVATRLSSRIIDLTTLLILARVLTPADFGLTAIAASFVSIVEMVFEIPLVQALLRLPQIEKAHLDTAFTISVVRAVVIAILMALAAWPVAYFYHDARLLLIVVALSVCPIARSLYSPAIVNLYRDIDFRASFVADFSGKVIATLVSLIALYAGAGYWTLVINPVASSVLPTMLSYVLAPYRPNFSLAKFSDFSTFTGWFTSSQVLAALSWQYDRIFLGYNVSKSILGQYGVASDFSVLPTQSLIGPAMRPVMAAFASISDDERRLKTAFLKAAQLTMLIALPAGTGIALTADQIVHIILGDQWSTAAVYLRWFSLAVMLTAYYQPVSSLCLALNRPNFVFKICALDSTIKVGAMTVGFYVGGIMFMIYARVLVAIIQVLISAYYAKKLISAGIFMQMCNLWQTGISCLFMAVFVMSLQIFLERIDVGLPVLLGSMIFCGALVYGACMYMLGFRLGGLRP